MLGITFVLTFHLLNEPSLNNSDLTQFTGTVTEARVIGKNHDYLEIRLSDQPYRFRCFRHFYPSKFNQEVVGLLGPGVPVTLGVPSSEAGSPHRNLMILPFHEFLTMKIAGQDALVISAYNDRIESERRYGTWLCLAMGIGSLYLIITGLRDRNSSAFIRNEGF